MRREGHLRILGKYSFGPQCLLVNGGMLVMLLVYVMHVLIYYACHRIKHTYILDDPFEDPPQLAELIPDASPEGKPKEEVCIKISTSLLLFTLLCILRLVAN